MDNKKQQSFLKYATSTLNLSFPCLRLTNLKCPTSNRIDYDLLKLCKTESPTIYGLSLPI